MSDPTIKLGLDLGDAQAKAKAFKESLDGIDAAAQGMAESFVYAATAGNGYETSVVSAKEADQKAAAAAKEAAAARKQAAREVAEAKRAEVAASKEAAAAARAEAAEAKQASREKVAAARAAAAAAREAAREEEASHGGRQRRLNEASQGALKLSQQAQDVAQGGWASALNGIDGIVGSFGKSLGLSATAATTLSATLLGVGTAALVAGPPLFSWFKSLMDGSNETPKAADALDRLNAVFNTAKERLAELKGQQTLTNRELEEYRKLLPEVTRLEKEANAEKERRNALEKARKEEGDALNPSDPDAAKVAKAVQDQLGGVDSTVNAARNALTAEDPELQKLRAQAADLARKGAQRRRDDPNNLTGEGFYDADQAVVQGRIDAAMKRIEARAADLATKAREGNQGAIGELARVLPGAGFAAAEPAGLAAAKDREAAVKREDDRLAGEAKAREDKAKADAKRADDESKAKQTADREKDRRDDQFDNAVGRGAEGLAAINEGMARDLEKGARDLQGDGFADVVRDVEASEFGGLGLSGNQVDTIADEVRKASQAGVNPMEAAAAAIRNLLDANAQLQQRYAELGAQFNQYAAMAQQQANQARTSRTRLSRGRFEAPTDAANGGAASNHFAADDPWGLMQERVGQLMQQQPATPSLIGWGAGW